MSNLKQLLELLAGDIKRIDDTHDYDELRFAKTPKKAKRIKTKTPKKQIGKLGEFKLFLVDGEYVRNHVDIDFVAGGNPARYAYCPKNELWVEEIYETEQDHIDIVASALHEYYECMLMSEDSLTYNKAHGTAAKLEKKFRLWMEKHPSGNIEKLLSFATKIVDKKLKQKHLNEAHFGKFNNEFNYC